MPLNNLGLGKTLVLMFCICIKIGWPLSFKIDWPLSGVIMQVLYVCAEVLNALTLIKGIKWKILCYSRSHLHLLSWLLCILFIFLWLLCI